MFSTAGKYHQFIGGITFSTYENHNEMILIKVFSSLADAEDVLARTTIIGVILCFRSLLMDGLESVS